MQRLRLITNLLKTTTRISKYTRYSISTQFSPSILNRDNFKMTQKRPLYDGTGLFTKKSKLSARDIEEMLSDSDSDWEFTMNKDTDNNTNSNYKGGQPGNKVMARPAQRKPDQIVDFDNKKVLDRLPLLQLNKKTTPHAHPLSKLPNVSQHSHGSSDSGSPTKPISISDEEITDKNVYLDKSNADIHESELDTDLEHAEVVTGSPLQSTTAATTTAPSITEENNKDINDSFESVENTGDLPDITNEEVSLEIMHTQKKSEWGGKISLQTQIIPFNDPDGHSIKLPANTRIKVPIFLSKEQEHIIELAKDGYNIFYTGSAGTGKSVLLREMIKVLKRKYGFDHVAVTASTGLAACNIGGVTVHSFAGIGLGQGDPDKLYKKVRRSKKHLHRWEKISALVIDEISMLDGELLDKLDYIARKIRKNHRPFGGIQVVFCGDFFQLPPVSKNPEKPMQFAFDSKSWKEGIKCTIMLQKVFRQQGDTKFIDMLNKMRLGQIDDETELEFKKLNRPLPDDDIIPAELYSTRNEVDRANSIRLNKLPGKVHNFNAIDGGSLDDKELKEKLLQNFLAPKHLQLKVGAQVMMIKNVDATLVNGSLGKIIDFIDRDTYMFYETMNKNPELTVGQLEAIKKDPATLKDLYNEENEVGDDDGKVRQKLVKDSYCKYEPEESHTPLSESIFDFLKDETSDHKESRQNINRKKALLRELHSSSKQRKLPLVRFKTSDMATRTVLVEPEDWAIEDENGKQLVSRVQIPLMLAWSLSIHKSQGQTLPRVKVDLRRVFEKGQAYVALSRAVSREGLQVLNFNKLRVGAHEKVIDFYKTLVSAENAIQEVKSRSNTLGDGDMGEDLEERRNKGSNRFQHKLEYAPPLQQILSRKRSTSTRLSRSASPAKDSGGITNLLVKSFEKK